MEACLPQSVKLDDVEALRRLELGEDPDSAEDYLFRVRLEASNLPEVLEASRRTDNGASTDFNTRKRATKPYLPHVEIVKPCPEGLQPSKEWCMSCLRIFKQLREYLMSVGGQGSGSKTIGVRRPAPALRDELGWHILCFGSVGYLKTCSSYVDKISTDPVEEETTNPSPYSVSPTTGSAATTGLDWFSEYPHGTMPKVSMLLQFDQVLSRKLLQYQSEWLGTAMLSRARAIWIFSLLSRLSLPLDASTSAIVRDVARRCCNERAELQSSDDQRLPPLNLIIVICAQFFGQAASDEVNEAHKL
eukprot:279373_1